MDMSEMSDIGDKMAKMWLNVDILVEEDISNESDVVDIADILQNCDKSDILDFHVQPDKLDNEDESVSSVIREQRSRRAQSYLD